MVNANSEIRNQIQQTDIRVFPSFWGKVKDILSKVWEAIKLIFYVLAGAALFIANASLFAIGFAAGIIFDVKFKEISDKVMRIYAESQWKVLTLIGIGAFLSLPVTAATIAVGYGGHLGYSLLNMKKNEGEEEPLGTV